MHNPKPISTLQFKIEVPVERHVRSYILHLFNKAEVIPLPRKHWIGITLYSLLEKNVNHRPLGFRQPDYQVTFALGEFDFYRTGANLSPVKACMFNDLVDSYLKEKLFHSVDLVMKNYPEYRSHHHRGDLVAYKHHTQRYRRRVETIMKQPEIRQAILAFMDQQGLGEDDVTYESLKKAYYRYRKKIEEKAGKSM